MSTSVSALIVAAAQNFGVPPALALEVAQRESGMNPNVADGAAGEIGIFQIEPATGAELGYSVTDLRDPTKNIQAGVTYLGQMLARYGGDPAAGLAAYNAGPGTVDAAMATYGSNWFSYVPAGTQSYVSAILGNVSTQYTASLNPAPSGGMLLPASPASGSIWATLAIAAAVIFGLGYVLSYD
jgi:soluble lytic murein transglycosylase-like protein